jgi:hypothetical protein
MAASTPYLTFRPVKDQAAPVSIVTRTYGAPSMATTLTLASPSPIPAANMPAKKEEAN